MTDDHRRYREANGYRMAGDKAMAPHMPLTRERAPGNAASGVTRCLSLAAAPTFAIMALLTLVPGGMPDPLCSAASPLSGMATMYLLMSVFHSASWLKLVCSRQSHPRQS